jgi:hypothetical protein
VTSGTILGLKPDQSKNSVSGNARLAVIRGHAARQTYRGVISNPQIVEVAAESTVPQAVAVTATSAPTTQAAGSKRKRGAEDVASKKVKAA